MPIYVVTDPDTGEEVELEAPDGMSQSKAYSKAFGSPVTRALKGVQKSGENARNVFESGITKAALGAIEFPWMAGVGLGSKATGVVDALAGTNLQEGFESGAKAVEDFVGGQEGVKALKATSEMKFPDMPSRVAREVISGAAGGAMGGGKKATLGATAGGTGGALGQAAQEMDLPPEVQLLATVFPSLAAGGWTALRDPIAVKQMKSALAATNPMDLAKAKELIAIAKERGVDLSPAQALGQNHPLVPILEQVGRSTGGSDKVKVFLNAQEAPTNVLTDQVSNAFGKTDASTAANVVANKAAKIRSAQEKAPGKLAAPYYKAAESEPLPPGLIAGLESQLQGLKSNLAPNGADVRLIDNAIKLLKKGDQTNVSVKARINDDGTLELVRGTEIVSIPLDTYGQLKNVRDLTKPADTPNVPIAGDFPTTGVTQNKVGAAIREASKTSPNISAADAIFAKRMRDLEKVRMGPLTQLAGPQMREPDVAANFSRVEQFLDPARNSPSKVDKTLSQLSDPENSVVQQLLAGRLQSATEKVRKTEGFAPARLETELRGGEGSGKAAILESLIRRAVGEQNKANPNDPLDITSMLENLTGNLDVMQATGRGRGALTGVENIPRVAAQLDTPVQLARGSAGNVISQTPSLIRFGEERANKQLAEALTDPSMKKMLDMNEYDRLELVAEILRRMVQTTATTGE